MGTRSSDDADVTFLRSLLAFARRNYEDPEVGPVGRMFYFGKMTGLEEAIRSLSSGKVTGGGTRSEG